MAGMNSCTAFIGQIWRNSFQHFLPLCLLLVLCYVSSLEAQLSSYGGGGSSGAGGRGSGSTGGGSGSLEESLPGTPGDDYPIYASVPDTGFTCDGQVILDLPCIVISRQGAITGGGW